jgi:hypothetical protein
LTTFGLSVFEESMITKICTLCKKDKELDEYYLDSRMLCGRTSGCKECLSYKNKIQKRKKYDFKPRVKNHNLPSYYSRNKERLLLRKKEYDDNPINKEKRKQYIKEYNRKQRLLNKSYKVRDNISRRIRSAINNGYKSKKTLELLGCSIEELKKYLEKQFREGMSWKNYGLYGWHIDHIIPCSSFDLTNIDQQKICFHYTNLQPLWAKDNLSKGNKSSISIL